MLFILEILSQSNDIYSNVNRYHDRKRNYLCICIASWWWTWTLKIKLQNLIFLYKS